MKGTFLIKPGEVKKKWYIIDAKDKPLGRVATVAASILRGKHRPTFTPNVDCGDNVIILNAAKVAFTGKKLENKFYYRHTGYVGNLKSISLKELMEKKPEKVMLNAIKGMLPKNSLGRKMLTNVRVYRNDKHEQEAQRPEIYNG